MIEDNDKKLGCIFCRQISVLTSYQIVTGLTSAASVEPFFQLLTAILDFPFDYNTHPNWEQQNIFRDP